MVPLYQIVVGLAVAAVLVLLAVYGPFWLKRPLPRWLELCLGAVAVIVMAGVLYTLRFGYWPFRG